MTGILRGYSKILKKRHVTIFITAYEIKKYTDNIPNIKPFYNCLNNKANWLDKVSSEHNF